MQIDEIIKFISAPELTISSDAITVTQANHKLQPESGTADNLSTINGTSEGQFGVLYVSDFGTDTITIKHNVGNILCVGAADIALSHGCVFWYSDGTKVFCSGGGGGGGTVDYIGRKRLSLASATPVTITDQTAKTTVYWTDGTVNLSVAVPATTNTPFDIFYSISGNSLSTVNWTNDTTRATALAYDGGMLVKSGDTDKLYLGTGRTTGSSGQCEDSRGNASQSGGKRFLWNYYNRVLKALDVIDTTDSWNYGTATWRQANNAAGNKVEFIVGVAEDLIRASVQGAVALASNGASAYFAVGVDVTNAPSGLVQGGFNGSATTLIAPVSGSHQFIPAVGYHYLAWLEKGTTGTVTFEGDQAGNGYQSGLTAFLLG
jgi:hypothetical protein